MFKNYLKTSWRSLMKNKFFSLIKISGLAIGLACFVLIGAFVYDELNYDRYPEEARNIYRVNLSVTGNGDVAHYPDVDDGVGPGMKNAFAEIKAFARLSATSDFVKFDDKQFKEDKLAFCDSNFLKMFSIPLIEGSDDQALVQPNSIVISSSLARKYFGDLNPLGRSLIVGLNNQPFKVTGVFDRVPANTHFHYDAFLSMTTYPARNPTWTNMGDFTYLVLNEGVDPKKLQAKFPKLVFRYVVAEAQHDMGLSLAEAEKTAGTFIFGLQPLTEIHLYSHTKYELEPNGDIQYVYIFSVLALFILALACINFTNLSIASSAKRAREVAVRKVMGSAKSQLIKQFLSESLLMSFLAMVLAMALVTLLLPFFNQLAGKNLSVSLSLNFRFILFALVLILVVGIAAGIYPSFFLSSLNATKILKGPSGTGHRKNLLRSGLIVFQFFVSTALIVSTLVVYKQLHYMQNKKLGYDKEQVLYLPDGRLMVRNEEAFKEQLLSDGRVVSATISRSVPGDNFMGGTEVHPIGEHGSGADIHMNIYQVDYDYLKTLGIQMKQGRFFSRDFGSDSVSVVINEAAMNQLGWAHTDPVGKNIVRSGQIVYQVVGVVKDFNYTSAKDKIAPLMMLLGNNYGGLIVKIKTADVTGLLSDLIKKWDSLGLQRPLSYSFLDDKFAALYASELTIQKIIASFALIAILIAALGLFALSAFEIAQRTREIGIRKVLGASVRQVTILVSREFLMLVVLAFLVAAPVTYWGMNQWLQNYAYRTTIGPELFLAGAFSATVIALVTISFHAIREALADPVKSLRAD